MKFADDTSQVGLIEKGNDSFFKQGINDFVTWCKNNFLKLNVSKTKEMIINFTRSQNDPEEIVIDGSKVQRVEFYKYLGVVFDNKLKFAQNMNEIVKKVNSRLLCLYKLRSFHVKTEILQTFYTATIRSVFSYGAICWEVICQNGKRTKLKRLSKGRDQQ